MSVACNGLSSCDKSSLQDEFPERYLVLLWCLCCATHAGIPPLLQFYCCLPTVTPASSCSSFETTHFAVYTYLIWKALNHPGTFLTRQILKHHLYLKLCWQVPCETYSKFTQMKNRSPHCTLPLNHCIPPFLVLQMQVLSFVTSLHFSYFPLIKGVQSITESKFSTCSVAKFYKTSA